MNIESYEKNQEAVLHDIALRYLISEEDINEVKCFAGELGHYVMNYIPYQNTFLLSDGEPYTLGAVRQHRKITYERIDQV